MRTTIILLSLFSMTLAAFAEPAPAGYPPPRAPLVAHTPAHGAWTFKLQSQVPPSTKSKKKPPTPADPTPVITEVSTTQTGRLRLEEVTYSDGKTVQNWYVEGILLLTILSDGTVSAIMIEPDWDRTGIIVPTGFAGFTWIKKEYYLDVGDFEKRTAYHYKRTSEDGLELEAWVDADSNLPAAFRAGSRIYVYSFETERPKPLVLPEPLLAVERRLESEIEYRKKLEKELEPKQ